ncbi:MAG: hypothetical protein COA79_14295 [Planctomycetota bacterium]|nr:MAG: hypothetical protein COA79_14295 [Planctomycetota bacterium]
MNQSNFHGCGTFAFYFLKPEKISPILDRLGFSKGFKRIHPSGLTLYIHRGRNKKDCIHSGVTPVIYTPSLETIKNDLKGTNTQIQNIERFGHPALQLNFDEHNYLILVEGTNQECLLPENSKAIDTNATLPIIGNGHFILKSKDPIKSSAWYANLFSIPAIYESPDLAINYITSSNNSSLIIFHEKKIIKHKNRPPKYKLYGLTTNNIYDCWGFLKQQQKISPTWKHPQSDGHWRTININGPEGYTWKLYGSIPVYTLDIASQLLQVEKLSMIENTKNGSTPSLPEKFIPQDKLSENDNYFYCEDQLLEHLRKESPYEKKLQFDDASLQSQFLNID